MLLIFLLACLLVLRHRALVRLLWLKVEVKLKIQTTPTLANGFSGRSDPAGEGSWETFAYTCGRGLEVVLELRRRRDDRNYVDRPIDI